MFVTDVELVDFRNYEHATLQFAPGANVLTGPNGHGKTNIVEAVAYLASLSSHRVATDVPLVRLGAQQAIVRAKVTAGLDDRRSLTLELEINSGAANRARLNGVPRRPRDLLGCLRVVAFTPDDLGIVEGDPAERRNALDDVVQQRWPRLVGVKLDYDKVLRQRNALLKAACGRGRLDAEAAATLDVWDAQLVAAGTELVLARARTIADLSPHLAEAYAAIAPATSAARAEYAPRLDALRRYLGEGDPARDDVAALLAQGLGDRRADEVRRGVSLVGPHRDEIELHIGELPAKGYASHGEAWSLALSWRLAAFGLLRAEASEPVLILDDVFAELDAGRRRSLADAAGAAEQTLITAAVLDDVPDSLWGHRFDVSSGTVAEHH